LKEVLWMPPVNGVSSVIL